MVRPVPALARRTLGVSLIEVLLALAVLTIGLGYLVQLQTNTVKHSGEYRARVRAQLLAFQKAEEIRAIPFQDLQRQMGTDELHVPTEGPEPIDLSSSKNVNPALKGNWSAILSKSDELPDAIEIRSMVKWGESSENQRLVEHVAYVFD